MSAITTTVWDCRCRCCAWSVRIVRRINSIWRCWKWECRRRHEIQRLCKITPPDVAVELMVAPVHLEYLGTIENIAAAKAELIEGMKPEGTAILNADDVLVMKMREKHQGRTLTFGIDNAADVSL